MEGAYKTTPRRKVPPRQDVPQPQAQADAEEKPENYYKSALRVDYDAAVIPGESEVYVQDENVIEEIVEEVTVGDPNAVPRLGRLLAQREWQRRASPGGGSATRSRSPWSRRHHRAGSPSPARPGAPIPAPAPNATPYSDTPDSLENLYEEIELSRNMRAVGITAEERQNLLDDLSPLNPPAHEWSTPPPSQTGAKFTPHHETPSGPAQAGQSAGNPEFQPQNVGAAHPNDPSTSAAPEQGRVQPRKIPFTPDTSAASSGANATQLDPQDLLNMTPGAREEFLAQFPEGTPTGHTLDNLSNLDEAFRVPESSIQKQTTNHIEQ